MWSLLVALLSLTPFSVDPASHIRAASPIAHSLLDEATVRSPIVNALIARLRQTDAIVYVEFTGSPDIPRARTKLVAAPRGARFLRISISVLVAPTDRLPLLAHELQHAAEIAEDADARDDNAVRRLYQRIGTGGVRDRFETAAAGDVERKVRAEQVSWRRGQRSYDSRRDEAESLIR